MLSEQPDGLIAARRFFPSLHFCAVLETRLRPTQRDSASRLTTELLQEVVSVVEGDIQT